MPGKLISLNSGKWTPRILLKKKRNFPAETLNLSIINHTFLLLTEIIININLVLKCIMELNICLLVFIFVKPFLTDFSQILLVSFSFKVLFSHSSTQGWIQDFLGDGIKCTHNYNKLKVGQEGRECEAQICLCRSATDIIAQCSGRYRIRHPLSRRKLIPQKFQ